MVEGAAEFYKGWGPSARLLNGLDPTFPMAGAPGVYCVAASQPF